MLEISPRATRSLKDGVRVRVHHGSGNVPAHVALGSGKELAAGGRELAQLRLEAPAFVFAGDHLTVRDWSEQQTLAGAVVLDPDAHAEGISQQRRGRRGWSGRRGTRRSARIRRRVRRSRHRGSPRRSCFVKIAFQPARRSTPPSIGWFRQERVVAAGDVLVDAGDVAGSRGPEAAEAHRRRASRAPRASRPAARPTCAARSRRSCRSTSCSMPLIASLCEREFVRSGRSFTARRTARELPEPLQAAGAKLSQALAAQAAGSAVAQGAGARRGVAAGAEVPDRDR